MSSPDPTRDYDESLPEDINDALDCFIQELTALRQNTGFLLRDAQSLKEMIEKII